MRASTFALKNGTLTPVLAPADHGYAEALTHDPLLRTGLNVHAGTINCKEFAEALNYEYVAPEDALRGT